MACRVSCYIVPPDHTATASGGPQAAARRSRASARPPCLVLYSDHSVALQIEPRHMLRKGPPQDGGAKRLTPTEQFYALASSSSHQRRLLTSLGSTTTLATYMDPPPMSRG